MHIFGFSKTTLLDYPKHVAATIFTGACNFRCPFCHNGDLVLDPMSIGEFDENEVLSTLKKRNKILEGVCITGGEPTLQKDLPEFIKKVRDIGLLVKLDSNGYRPEVLESLLKDNLLDYVAMDIKNSPDKYQMTVGIPDFDISRINQSVEILKNCDIPYEFRTTVVKELHSESDFIKIGEWLQGAPLYFLQSYKDSEAIISPGFSAYSAEELNHFKDILTPYLPSTEIRGVD